MYSSSVGVYGERPESDRGRQCRRHVRRIYAADLVGGTLGLASAAQWNNGAAMTGRVRLQSTASSMGIYQVPAPPRLPPT